MTLPCLLAAVAGGCGGSARAPDRLLDGSQTLAPAVELAGVDGPAILTKVRTTTVAEVEHRGSAAASCVGQDWGTAPAGPVVERIGVIGESVTFANASHDQMLGCDNSAGPREDGRRWCGGAAGQLHRHHLFDPRLDIICVTSDKTPVGFVWVEPSPTTRYVAVDQGRYTEVYEVAGGLPVRIATTSDVAVSRARAAFEISEHDSTGRLIRRYGVQASVAG